MSHWYVAPPGICGECGNPHADPTHYVKCDSIWSFGPGFAFCEEPRGHDGPHRLRNWNNAVYLAYPDGTTEQIEPPRPFWEMESE